MIWLGFLSSIFALLILARKDLAIGLFAAALILGLFTCSPFLILEKLYQTLSDPSIVLLAGVVFCIPLIGGVLDESGQMNDLITNMRIGQKPFLAFSPALLGMLPMPGGALLSAPLVEKGGGETSPQLKASINVWFRHVLFLIYPLGPALIASAKIADLEVYRVIPYLFPSLIFALLLGYYFFLKNIQGGICYQSKFSLKRLLIPLVVILAAPVTDFLLKSFFNFRIPETASLIGVIISLGLGILFARLSLKDLYQIGKEMKPWEFALIIFGMFAFLNIFKVSGTPQLIADLQMPASILCVLGGYLLGVTTGRIQAPASIIIPIYFFKFGEMTPIAFSITFFSMFLGYCASPIHPCVSVSLEFFDTSIHDFLTTMVPPTLIALIITLLFSMIWL